MSAVISEARKFAGERVAKLAGYGAVGDVHARMIVSQTFVGQKNRKS